jgi:hypothetical protein
MSHRALKNRAGTGIREMGYFLIAVTEDRRFLGKEKGENNQVCV